MRPSIALLAALVFVGTIVAQDPVPGGIKLLPGYKHEKQKGIDTRVGRILKEGGLAIQYDIGRGAGNAVKSLDKDTVVWSKEQTLAGQTVLTALTKDRTLYVTFPQTSANFIGLTKSDADVADMLLMTLTYTPSSPK